MITTAEADIYLVFVPYTFSILQKKNVLSWKIPFCLGHEHRSFTNTNHTKPYYSPRCFISFQRKYGWTWLSDYASNAWHAAVSRMVARQQAARFTGGYAGGVGGGLSLRAVIMKQKSRNCDVGAMYFSTRFVFTVRCQRRIVTGGENVPRVPSKPRARWRGKETTRYITRYNTPICCVMDTMSKLYGNL